MKRPRYIYFKCPEHHEHFGPSERFVETDDDGNALEEQRCQVLIDDGHNDDRYCDQLMTPVEIGIGYVKDINRNNSDFSAREKERLTKRANDHWNKKGRHEAYDREQTIHKKLNS